MFFISLCKILQVQIFLMYLLHVAVAYIEIPLFVVRVVFDIFVYLV